MTLRDDLYRTKIKIIMIMYPLILAYFLLLFLGTSVIDPISAGIGAFMALVGVLVCFAVFYKKPVCPECGFNFYFLSVKRKKSNQVNLCPGCGLALDSEVP